MKDKRVSNIFVTSIAFALAIELFSVNGQNIITQDMNMFSVIFICVFKTSIAIFFTSLRRIVLSFVN